MVVTRLAPTALTPVTHERMGCPSRCTVHAPHKAMPQPNLVPVRPSVSRSTHSNGMSGSTSTSVSLPLTLSLIIAPPAPEHPANERRSSWRALIARGTGTIRPAARGAHPLRLFRGRPHARGQQTLYNALRQLPAKASALSQIPTHTTPAAAITTEVVIIGAGLCGLFQVFELGLLGSAAHVVDSLRPPGGQCAALSPDKPIYDIPALPVCGAQELVDRLMQQIHPFKPQFHLGEEVTTVVPDGAGRFTVGTSGGTEITVGALVIAAG